MGEMLILGNKIFCYFLDTLIFEDFAHGHEKQIIG
jgi:hypothetical protein